MAETERYLQSATAANTVKAYRSDWSGFETFCEEHQLPSLPAAPATLAAYAADAARQLKARTVEQHLTAISQAHQLAGYPNPAEDKLVRTVMAGIRRVKGTGQREKEPLSPDILRKMFAGAAEDLRTVRNRALLLVGFSGAFRGSELVTLRHEDLRFGPEGVDRHHPAIENGPGRGRANGSASLMAPIRKAVPCGPSTIGSISPRSGTGLATSAVHGGISERSIMDQTRQQSVPRQCRSTDCDNSTAAKAPRLC